MANEQTPETAAELDEALAELRAQYGNGNITDAEFMEREQELLVDRLRAQRGVAS